MTWRMGTQKYEDIKWVQAYHAPLFGKTGVLVRGVGRQLCGGATRVHPHSPGQLGQVQILGADRQLSGCGGGQISIHFPPAAGPESSSDSRSK